MKRIFIGLCSFAFFSCAAQIEQKMKSVVLLSPEAQGAGELSVGAGYQDAPLVVITEDARRLPPDRTATKVQREDKVYLHGGIGLTNRIDFFLDPASWATGKIQILGDPFLVSSKGNFSLAALASLWYDNDIGRGKGVRWKSTESRISVANDATYSKSDFAWRLGALGGYRVLDPMLVYLGFHHQHHGYHGDFEIVNLAKGRYAGSATATSVNVGIEYALKKSFVIRFEDAYTVSRVPAFGARSSGHFFGLVFAGTFNAVTQDGPGQ